METIENYKNRHVGQSCAILGGGVSLPADLRQIDEVDILMGVNQHAVVLPLDYLVFRDRHMWPFIKEYRDIKLITQLNRFNESHVIHAGVSPFIGYSGAMAFWIADYMGFERIDVCGMDQYNDRKDGREYWWQGPQAGEFKKHSHCNSDLELLKKFIDSLQHPERIFFVSGRLKELHQ